MSGKYKFHNSDKLYFVSFAVIYWIDLFVLNEYKDIMLESWRHCQIHKGLELYGWCIMTSHIHMLIGSGDNKPENIMGDMKRQTSEKLRESIVNHPAKSERVDAAIDAESRKGKLPQQRFSTLATG